jgi:hypothetical protein
MEHRLLESVLDIRSVDVRQFLVQWNDDENLDWIDESDLLRAQSWSHAQRNSSQMHPLPPTDSTDVSDATTVESSSEPSGKNLSF